jgi:hydrogenase/urease accessory protein HupE
MSRILTALVLLSPTPVLAHVGAHEFGLEGNLLHSLSQPDHMLAFVAALAIPTAAGVLIWRRFK